MTVTRGIVLVMVVAVAACSEERPESETVYETSCEDIEPNGACMGYDRCCTDAVHLEDEVEVDRHADSCWFDVEGELFDCRSPSDCDEAELAAAAMACGT